MPPLLLNERLSSRDTSSNCYRCNYRRNSVQRECKLVIESTSEDGGKFRPSDWIERISTSLASFGPDHRLRYSKKAQPGVINGEKCLVVDKTLNEKDPAAFEYIINFAKANRLRVHEECWDYSLSSRAASNGEEPKMRRDAS